MISQCEKNTFLPYVFTVFHRTMEIFIVIPGIDFNLILSVVPDEKIVDRQIKEQTVRCKTS